jgi:hypothetical protein
MTKQHKPQQDAAPAADGGDEGTATRQVPKERAHFRALVLANPNYFGNLGASAFTPVLPIQSNTTYEEIGCVGFQPQAKRLDAVVYVKQPFGYGGDICSAGTQEHVRFYISFDNGASWIDQGYASFNVYDVPEGTAGAKRLEYAVTVPCDPRKKLCFLPNTILARAILAWNQIPPPNQPNFVPVWGEVHNTHIQVDPRFILDWIDAVGDLKLKLPPQFAELVDFAEPLKLKAPKELSVAELHAAYRGKGVEPHRYALPAVQALLAQPAAGVDLGPAPAASIFADLGLNLGEVVGPIVSPGDGSTFYEEMECVGFNPGTNELVAVLRVKKPNGYSGGPCTAGSLEHVTFWADLNGNGFFETCLGTASVRVHDIQNIPPQGLEYSVYLPVDFGALKRPCDQGPRLIPIRAILSWASAAPCAFPNKAPVWGNREDTLILLPPGKATVPGDFKPVLFNISTVAVCDIAQATGFAPGDRPFGGRVYIVGDIPAANTLATPDRFKYRLFVRQLPAGSWQPVANDFAVTVDQQSGPGTLVQLPLLQEVDSAGPYMGYYTYREFGIGSSTWRRIAAPYMGLLGVWQTAQPMAGRWEIRIEAIDTFTNVTYFADTTHCPDGTTRTNVIVKLDEDRPVPAIGITDFSTDGGVTWQPAGDCDDFVVGVRIRGNYSVSDAHFGSLSLTVEPSSAANGATPSPSSRTYPVVPTGGEAGVWTLDTGPMDPCGFVVRIDVVDRTIVSANGGWRDHATVGFCLRAAPIG